MDARILKLFESIVKSRFSDAKILSVDVAEDEDSDGDRVLRVTVVFESESGELNPSEAAGIVRHMRPKLREVGEMAFPIFSFVKKSESGLSCAPA